ncbi:hypothetical protein [Taibaiella chishuiensis]|uniref:Uncharacterized protein n=1 Tax=Taibaiella chishuiensis TaxID=1434707 RepID=A0A2P8D0D3_9BACT|nr:hypothetical protein [Taibaiella chishuiensis]PSK90679.1 hypothetical protein B0I18_10789 [Taibaiella chishuiensis]
MDDNQKKILSDSLKVISKLQLLAAFFEEEVIFKIYIRTQVIHKMFEHNPELDIHKLELFHLQFTESVLDLLRKIKKTNEKNVSLVFDEIELNKELIIKINDAMRTEQSFEFAQQKQTAKINLSLNKLYQNLSDLSTDFPFGKNISQFSARYAGDFFYEVGIDFFYELIAFDPDAVYKNGYGIIGKKLMGLQCRHNFSNLFYCGLKAGSMTAEVYRMAEEAVYFIFYPARNLFLECDEEKISGIDLSQAYSKRARTVQDLSEKNLQLEQQAPKMKTHIPGDILKLLAEYHEKVDGMDFMDFMNDFDVQANILKAMLNTDAL